MYRLLMMSLSRAVRSVSLLLGSVRQDHIQSTSSRSAVAMLPGVSLRSIMGVHGVWCINRCSYANGVLAVRTPTFHHISPHFPGDIQRPYQQTRYSTTRAFGRWNNNNHIPGMGCDMIGFCSVNNGRFAAWPRSACSSKG